jgi:hypothetical protein
VFQESQFGKLSVRCPTADGHPSPPDYAQLKVMPALNAKLLYLWNCLPVLIILSLFKKHACSAKHILNKLYIFLYLLLLENLIFVIKMRLRSRISRMLLLFYIYCILKYINKLKQTNILLLFFMIFCFVVCFCGDLSHLWRCHFQCYLKIWIDLLFQCEVFGVAAPPDQCAQCSDVQIR